MAIECDDGTEGLKGQLLTRIDARKFALGGKATFTIVSKASGARYTFKVKFKKASEADVAKWSDRWFVSLLTGPDNDADFAYIGTLDPMLSGDAPVFRHGRKSRIGRHAPGVTAFEWMWEVLRRGDLALPESLEIWHEGRCGRCNRKLTVPASISSGFGPECIGKL